MSGIPTPGGGTVKRLRRGVSAILATLLLAAPASGRSQAPGNGGIASRLATLRANSWVQLEGMVQADGSILCTKVDLLTGDFLDDDWSLEGIIRSVDSSTREFVIGGIRVQTSQNTRFENPRGTLKAFAGLHAGMVVEVEGTYVKGRGLLAREVDDESDEVAGQPGVRSHVTVVGKVDRLDSRRHLIGAMGAIFRVTEKTRVRSVID